MANAILTPIQVTRAALVILHQKLNFVGSINRSYDDSFAKEGAKIGSTLKIRLPNQYVVTNGATLSTQDTTENSTTLQITSQKHVGLNFTSADLTLSIQDFSKRILEPAMTVLAANIEADAFNMLLDVYPVVGNIGTAIGFSQIMQAWKSLTDNLAPADGEWTALLNTQDNVDLVGALKGLFQDSSAIKKQYRDAMMGRTAGFDFGTNTMLPSQTTGTAAATTGYTVSGAGQTGSGINVTGGTTTFNVGDSITLAGCNRCHPETKADTGVLQPFVITAASGTNAASLSLSPAIVTTGGTQNVVASPTSGGAVVKVGAASGIYKPSLFYHKDAFTFATADLVLPKGQHFVARQELDGISMRIWQGADIFNDKFPCRVDVLYGFKTIRPQLACRVLSN